MKADNIILPRLLMGWMIFSIIIHRLIIYYLVDAQFSVRQVHTKITMYAALDSLHRQEIYKEREWYRDTIEDITNSVIQLQYEIRLETAELKAQRERFMREKDSIWHSLDTINLTNE